MPINTYFHLTYIMILSKEKDFLNGAMLIMSEKFSVQNTWERLEPVERTGV